MTVSASAPPLQRVIVGGICGAGKTTLARRIAELRGLEHIELDGLYHGPQWQPRPEFEQEATAVINGDRWVTDSTAYPVIKDLLWSRADTFVWLDLPRSLVMRRVIVRSIKRAWHREELWNGNRETFTSWFTADHPIALAARKYASRRSEIAERLAQPMGAHLHVVRLASATKADEWLNCIGY
jgi:adenylate kinase family enzyme